MKKICNKEKIIKKRLETKIKETRSVQTVL